MTDQISSQQPDEYSFHKVLVRQVCRYLGEDALRDSRFQEIFSAISETYQHADDDRVLTERSFDLSSKELADINHNIEREVESRTHELRLEHARFIASVNSLNAGLIICDSVGTAIVLNRAARQLLNYQVPSTDSITSAEHVPKDPPILTTEVIQRRFSNSFDLVKDMHAVMQTHTPIEHAAVQYGDRVLRVYIAPILSNSNDKEFKSERLGSIIFFEDITEQKILERSRDEFFSIASHELRTPLTAIKGNTSIMLEYFQEQLDKPELQEIVSDIYESSGRLIEIVNDFLDVSRLEQGRMIFKVTTFDLHKLIERSLYEMQSLVKDRPVQLTIDQLTLGGDLLVKADSDRTKQIIYNLVGNALKFTEAGEVRVKIEINGNFISVYVTDTGRGIPLKNQALLFHKFQQASSSILTRDASRGTGLGLYISKLMTERMGGTLKLENSVEGKGSSFSFSLPRA